MRTCPTLIRRGSAMSFSALSTLTVVPNRAAMPLRVSPPLTVYWRVPLGAGVVVGRGVAVAGGGVDEVVIDGLGEADGATDADGEPGVALLVGAAGDEVDTTPARPPEPSGLARAMTATAKATTINPTRSA
jgi:hypothetical protein